MKTTVARDGMLAYTLRDWTREKLDYIERYLDIFCTAMNGKWNLVYADLLAGPGLCVDVKTGEEASGSALLAIKRPEFSRIFLNDRDDEVMRVLSARIASDQMDRVQISSCDCNLVMNAARRYLFPNPRTQSTTLGVAVIDPQGYQMRFESIEELVDGLRIDLIIVFMSSFAKRFLAQPSMESPLGGMIGLEELERIRRKKRQGLQPTFEDLLTPIERQLNRIGYPHVITPTRTENSLGSTMYHIVFASRHERGQEFFRKISDRRWTGQRRLALW